MLSILYRLSFWRNASKKNRERHSIFSRVKHYLLRKSANFFVNIWYRVTFWNSRLNINESKKNERKVIVSLTSFPGRISTVWITIESLLRQTYKPDKIILWLAKEQFNSIDSLPKKLLEQQEKGLIIRFCDDLRSHKKYYYSFKEYPTDIIITVDDDIIYPKNAIEVLINLHKKYPDCICCNRGHIIKLNDDNTILPYKEWIKNPSGFIEPTKLLCPTGVSGVLYPPDSLDPEVFNKENIRKLSFYADDLWLKIMSLKKNTKVVKSSEFPSEFFTIESTQKETLGKINVAQNKNDSQLKSLLRNYEIGSINDE